MTIFQLLQYRQITIEPMSARTSQRLPFLNEVVFLDRNEEVLFEISEGLKPRLDLEAE